MFIGHFAPALALQRVRPGVKLWQLFLAVQFVVLELLGHAPGGWLRVRHPDGANGYVQTKLVWGA